MATARHLFSYSSAPPALAGAQVDVLQMSVLEFKDRPDSPLFHLEHFIDGDYIKYNSNSGFVEESIRLTPQVTGSVSSQGQGWGQGREKEEES